MVTGLDPGDPPKKKKKDKKFKKSKTFKLTGKKVVKRAPFRVVSICAAIFTAITVAIGVLGLIKTFGGLESGEGIERE